MQFGDMVQGTHFKEGNGKRKFIKLQNVLPSGLSQKTYRSVIRDDSDVKKYIECNSIDYDGIHSTCPDWLEFEVIKEPKTKCQKKKPA